MKSDFIPEELTLLDPSPASSHYAETFVYAPANAEEKHLGNLYIVASVYSNKSRKENAQLVSEIVTIIKNEYYKNTITTPLAALRFALKKTNAFLAEPKIASSRLASLSAKSKIKVNALKPAELLKIKIAVAVLKENTLHLARLGDVAAMILRNDVLQPVLTEPAYKKISRIEQPLSFENIVSGEILKDDHLVFATNQIYKISESELINALKSGALSEKIAGEAKSPQKSGLAGLAMIALKAKHPDKPPAAPPALGSLISSQDRKAVLALAHLRETPEEKEIREYNEEPIKEYMAQKKHRLKISVLAGLVLIAVGIITFTAIKLKNDTAVKRKEAENLVTDISNLRDKISPLIDIGNEKEADELLNEAQTKLKRLEELGYFNTNRASLSEDLAKIMKTLQHLEPIDNISAILDLTDNSAHFEPTSLAPGKNKLILYNADTIYKYDLNRGLGNFDALSKDYDLKTAIEDPADSNKILLLTDNSIVLHSDSDTVELWHKPDDLSHNLEGFSEYSKSLYLLDSGGNIYKLDLTDLAAATTTAKTKTVLTAWLGAQTKIEPPIFNIVVEGSIFGINRDKTAFELANGSIKNQIKLFEPVSQIFTLPTHKNIYLLSPEQGLIVVIDKNGNIKKRLTHPELQGAKSFFVNSQERIVYFLKGEKVYSFEI